MTLKSKNKLIIALLVSVVSTSLIAADGIKYAAIQKENGRWKVLSITDDVPTYQSGMEILSLPDFTPQFDKRFRVVRSQYGGIECPSIPDQTMYTPCNSYFFRFIGANFFGLGGIRVEIIPERYAEVRDEISNDETVAAIKSRADEAAILNTKARLEAQEKLKIKEQEEARIKAEKNIAEEKSHLEFMAKNLEKMSTMDRGLEDSCARVRNPGLLIKDPARAEIKCQFGGAVLLENLATAGWLIVNKNRDSDGVVTDYLIRKAR